MDNNEALKVNELQQYGIAVINELIKKIRNAQGEIKKKDDEIKHKSDEIDKIKKELTNIENNTNASLERIKKKIYDIKKEQDEKYGLLKDVHDVLFSKENKKETYLQDRFDKNDSTCESIKDRVTNIEKSIKHIEKSIKHITEAMSKFDGTNLHNEENHCNIDTEAASNTDGNKCEIIRDYNN